MAAELDALRQSRKIFLLPAPGIYRDVKHQYSHKPYDSDDKDVETTRQLRSLLESLPDVHTQGSEFPFLSVNFPSTLIPKEVASTPWTTVPLPPAPSAS